MLEVPSDGVAAAVVVVATAGTVLATRSDGTEPVAMSEPGTANEETEPPPGDASGAETGPATPSQGPAPGGVHRRLDDRLRRAVADHPARSDLEAYAETCGGRDPAGGHEGTCEEDFGSGS